MDVDMSLDDMIASKPRAGGRRGGSAGRGGRGAGGRSSTGRVAGAGAEAAPSNGGGARQRYAQGAVPIGQTVQVRQAQAASAVQSRMGGGFDDPAAKAVKIIVSNLPLDVDDGAVRDLFQSTVGPTRECYLAYDKNGKHKGVATVVFQKFGDAQKAHKSYNNRLIDGRTPMKVEVVLSALPQPSLSSRVAPVVAAPVTYVAAVPVAGQTGIAVPMAGGAAQATRNGGGRRRGGVAGGGRGGAKGERTANRPKKSQEDLDAEMESWTSTNAESTA